MDACFKVAPHEATKVEAGMKGAKPTTHILSKQCKTTTRSEAQHLMNPPFVVATSVGS
jgi:hypothetical protein